VKKHTNKPNPRAVALLYDSHLPPRVVAKGENAEAQLIMDAAARLGIPQSENSALVSALMQLDVEDSIPEELFVSVAVVLSWAYWSLGKTPEGYKN
jgi:flagellar biosynthesis protein